MNRRTALAAAATLSLALSFAPAFSAGVATYEAQTFAKAVASGPVVAHVSADWCLVCKAQKPTLASLANDSKFKGVTFITVDFDKDRDFLKTNKVANQSVIVVFKGGKEVARLSGVTDAAKIREGVAKAL